MFPLSSSIPITPLERLRVTDGLLLTADRWKRAHDYHRQRQNLHYQSLHEMGIVCGLGVEVIAAPTQFAAQYRDNRWLRIHPGIAIDSVGNPIIVPQPLDYRIAVEPPSTGSVMVYLVVSYVDPERLQRQTRSELVAETFRIDEKITPPTDLEVELCRILLHPGAVLLEQPPDLFSPGVNHPDLRFRQQARIRPLEQIRVAQLCQDGVADPWVTDRFSGLMRSLPGLYPTLTGLGEVGELTLQAESSQGQDSRGESSQAESSIFDYDLLYLTPQQLLALQDTEAQLLKQFLEVGGVLLLETSAEETNLSELQAVRLEIKQAIARLKVDSNLAAIQSELEAELVEINKTITTQIDTASFVTRNWADQMELPATGSGQLDRVHPIRTEPFLFAQFPLVQGEQTEILNWGGIVLVLGALSMAWGLDEDLNLSREEIRTAQEAGVNLLHFAWRRRQLAHWSNLQPNLQSNLELNLQPTSQSSPLPSSPTPEKPSRIQSTDILSKLDF